MIKFTFKLYSINQKDINDSAMNKSPFYLSGFKSLFLFLLNMEFQKKKAVKFNFLFFCLLTYPYKNETTV